jgi:1,4-alpha-glucan branching enzyme
VIHKTHARTDGRILVTFELPGSIWAAQVHLVGDFNEWNPTSHPLRQRRGGDWTITLELPANRRYEFRYLLDGTAWVNDDHADDYVLGLHGDDNSVVVCTLNEDLYR